MAKLRIKCSKRFKINFLHKWAYWCDNLIFQFFHNREILSNIEKHFKQLTILQGFFFIYRRILKNFFGCVCVCAHTNCIGQLWYLFKFI